MDISRRKFLGSASVAVAAPAVLRWAPAVSSRPRSSSAGDVVTGAAPPGVVNYALEQGADHWGEQLIARPEGPSFDAVQALLGPANIASKYVTESTWYYLPFTDQIYEPATWLQQRDFAIHVADGSQITAQWCYSDFPALRQYTTFQVGSTHEIYGSAVPRLDPPKLAGGFLPILVNGYTDGDGVRWDREAFVARVPQTTALVNLVRLRVTPASSRHRSGVLRIFLHVDNVSQVTAQGARLIAGGNTYLVSSVAGNWQAPNYDIPVDLSRGPQDIYLAVLNSPASASALDADPATYDRARTAVSKYWTEALQPAATVDVPEPYGLNAMRNLLLQNLVMGWQQSIGNGYESTDSGFAFIPEVSTSVAALGEFGFLDTYRANLSALLAKGQGDSFPNWERGVKLQSAANYYFLSNDASYLTQNLATFQTWLADFTNQRAQDPHGLVAKQQYGSDIPQFVYGVHHQSEVWRGLRDMGLALRQAGETSVAQGFLDQASAFQQALLAAIRASAQQLPDGSTYVPISLLDPNAPKAYDLIPGTRDGAYWNLIIPYALATGIMPPGSDEANGLLNYLYRHGSLLLGLTRFNESGINPPGVVESGPVPPFPPGAGGYDAPGVDEQYGYSLLKFLGDVGAADRLVMTYYGKLAQDLTPDTFIGGEGTTISPDPNLPDNFRSQWFPPLSANNAVYLRALRELLIHEERDTSGLPSVLHITPATPRPWLATGRRIAVSNLPTLFGPLGFTLIPNEDGNEISARIEPPPAEAGRADLSDVVLHVRTPAGKRLISVAVGGRMVKFNPDGESVRLGALRGPTNVVLKYRTVPMRRVDQARPTVITPPRLLVQPGDVLPLEVTVEAIGDAVVSGALSLSAPKGWGVPRSGSFAVKSAGRFGWQTMAMPLQVPADTKPGRYHVAMIASPRDGVSETRSVEIEVAVPAAMTYEQLVLSGGPAAFWRFDDSGTVASDATGHGVSGTYRGTVTQGQPGAIADDPSSSLLLVDGYIEVADNALIDFAGPYTLEAWIKVTTSRQQGIIEKYDPPHYRGYALRTIQANKLFVENLNDNDTLPPPVTGPTTVLPALWRHVAAVYDGTNVSIYLDGALEASTPSPAPTAGTNTLKLGARGDDGTVRLSAGWLDEVALYPRALSIDELRAHYLKGVLGKPKSS